MYGTIISNFVTEDQHRAVIMYTIHILPFPPDAKLLYVIEIKNKVFEIGGNCKY